MNESKDAFQRPIGPWGLHKAKGDVKPYYFEMCVYICLYLSVNLDSSDIMWVKKKIQLVNWSKCRTESQESKESVASC